MRKLGFLLFVLIILYFIFLIRQDIMDNRGLGRIEKGLKTSLLREERLAEKLKSRLKLLDQKEYIEELARTRLGLVMKGERAYKIINCE